MEGKSRECRRDGGEGGFTLLEVTLTLMLIVILMGGIYSIATGALQLGAEVSAAQNREMLVHSFLQLCRRNIERLPGNAQMTLEAEEEGRYYVTNLSFLESPLAFSFAAVPAGYDKAVLQSEADPRGWLNVNLLYFNEEEEDSLNASFDEEAGITLPLLDGVSVFEWRFYDLEEEEWMVVWEEEDGRPSFVELTLGFFDGGEPERTVFWVPPVADPETVIGNGQGTAPGGAGAGGAAGAGGGPGGRGAGGQNGVEGRPPRPPGGPGGQQRPPGGAGNPNFRIPGQNTGGAGTQ